MGWQQDGQIWDDAGDPGDVMQVGKAASAQFMNPDLPGRRVTVYAYPYASEKSHVTQKEGFETFHGFMHDMRGFGIETQIWYEIDDAGDADTFEPNFTGIDYEKLDAGPYSGSDEVMIAEAEQDALAWVMRYRPDQITWDGERF